MKHFIHLNDFSKQEVEKVFKLADKIKSDNEMMKPLRGKTIVLFFPENSIRTRVSFEKGIQLLGGHTILFPPTALDKKEDLRDVIGYLENWVDMVIVRHSELAFIEYMAHDSHIPIINAMTSENHPCEILSDLYSLSKKYTDFCDKEYLFIGARGNIGNTWKTASDLMEFKFLQCCPKGYEIADTNVCYDIEKAVKGKDVICTDTIPAGAEEDFKGYQMTLELMKKTNMNSCLNPCPPFFRGEEVSADVIDSEYFVGYEFKEHLLEVQQAIIYYLLLGCV